MARTKKQETQTETTGEQLIPNIPFPAAVSQATTLVPPALAAVYANLNAPIPRAAVSERQGSNGTMLSYLAGHYVIARMGAVFGNLGWSSNIRDLAMLHTGTIKDRFGKEKAYSSYKAIVTLTVAVPTEQGSVTTEHTEVGFGDGTDINPGKTHELAMKEAVTDALKRAAKNLGYSMGLALYDKEQTHVADEAPVTAPQAVNAPEIQPKTSGSVNMSHTTALTETIGKTAKVAIAQGKVTKDSLLTHMVAKYATDKKEELNEAQSREFLGFLNTLLYSNTQQGASNAKQ